MSKPAISYRGEIPNASHPDETLLISGPIPNGVTFSFLVPDKSGPGYTEVQYTTAELIEIVRGYFEQTRGE